MPTKESQLKASREWKQRNKDKVAAKQKEWRENNTEKRKIAKKEWTEQNKTHCASYNKEWKTKNPEYFVNKHLETTYGISLDDYNAILAVQDHKCAGCGVDASKAQRSKLYVDHCHDTGKVRGLLCQHCNTALGMVKDSIETLSSLISYLKQQK
jgi:hypothetical protein